MPSSAGQVIRCFVFVALGLFFGSEAIALSGSRFDQFRFVRDVLLFREGEAKPSHVVRWTKSLSVSVLIGNSEQKELVASVVRDLAAVIDGVKVSYVFSRDAEAQVVFASRRIIRRELTKDGVDPDSEIPGYFRAYSSEGKIWSATVFIENSQSADELRATVYQELTQILGPMGDSSIFPSSVMYETTTRWSTATALAPIDRKLLRFLYRYLKPGDDEAAVRAAFDKHWDSIPSD